MSSSATEDDDGLPKIYPVTVPDDSPVLRGLALSEQSELAGRHPRLPTLYEFHGEHPSHRLRFKESRTYVYLIDPSPMGKKIALKLWMSIKIPGGSAKGIQGLVDLQPGDMLLARPIDKNGDPTHDCFQALRGALLEKTLTVRMKLLLEGSSYTIEDVAGRIHEYELAREDLLGKRPVRQANAGKAAFELDPRAQPVANGPRCYPFSSMVQRPRQVEGPPASLKTIDNRHDPHQLIIRRYSLASTALNVLAWELQAPLRLLKAMREYGDHINTPRLGHHMNFYWCAQQNNVAGAKHPSEEHEFTDDQGFFSGIHMDEGDAGNGHSAGLGGSDLPDYAEPGRFHLVGQGVYFSLTYLSQVFFTGLLPHGGTPPLIPEHIEIEGWETRMFLISYPASSMLTGQARHPCAALPYEEFPLYVPPELTGAYHTPRDRQFCTTHVVYSHDGWVCMEIIALVNFLVRAFIQLLYWMLRQIPAEYEVQVDCDAITSAVTYLRDGDRVPADRWEFAPNPDVQRPFGEVHKKIQDAFLKTEYDWLMPGIPSVVENKYRDWDVTKIEYGGRPKAKQGTKRSRPAGSTQDSNPSLANASDNDHPPQKQRKLATVATNAAREALENAFPLVATNMRPLDKRISNALGCHATSVDNQSVDSSGARVDECSLSRTDDSRPSQTMVSSSGVPGSASVNTAGVDDATSTLGPVSLDIDNSQPSMEHPTVSHPSPLSSPSSSSLPLPNTNTHANANVNQSDPLCVDFVRSLIHDALPRACTEVKSVVLQSASGEHLNNALRTLDALPATLDSSSSSSYLSMKEIVSCSESLTVIRNHCHANTQWINLYHQQVMVYEAYMAVSIRHLVDDRCPYIVRNLASISADDNARDWLVRLTTKVTVLVESGIAVTASSTDFFKPTILTPRKFWEDPACVLRRKNLPSAKVEGTVLSYLRRILYVWFGSDTPFTAQARSAFVGCLIHRFGEHCLRLPLVWDTYMEMPSWLFTRDCPKLRNGDTSPNSRFELRFLNNLLAAFDICDPDRLAAESFLELGVLYESLQSRTKTHIHDVLLSRTRGAALKRLVTSLTRAVLPGSTTSARVQPRPVNQDAPANAQSPPQAGPSNSHAPSTNAEPGPSTLANRLSVNPNLPQAISPSMPSHPDRAVHITIQLLEDSYQVVRALRGSLRRRDLSKVQRVVFDKADFLLPLREEAPSRWAMNQKFDKTFAKSRDGFFSLQIFRFIHFNSGAFRDYPSDEREVQFSSNEEFNTYLAKVRAHFPKELEPFFCNKGALGQGIKARTTAKSGDYYIASRNTSMPWPPSRNFSTAWHDIKVFKKKVGSLWAGAGTLSQYLLLADMHFAGLVDVPSAEDMALVVGSVQLGGMLGLKSLGYLTDCTTKPLIEEKFLLFYNRVTNALSEDQRIRFGWSPIVAEHTLCKLFRLQGMGYYLQ